MRMKLCLRTGTWITAWVVSAAVARAEVWIVDASSGPGSTFTAIDAAVAAAEEGDTILVRNGIYRPFAIDGKSLSIVADGTGVRVEASASTTGLPTVRVSNLDAGQSVLVRGLRTNFGYTVSSCAGAVWFDELVCTGVTATCTVGVLPGAKVTNAARVTFTRCTLRGEGGSADTLVPAPPAGASEGVLVQSSTVRLYDCLIAGGKGVSAPGSWVALPTPGAAGLALDASDVTIVGCEIQGGGGGTLLTSPCGAGNQPGGAGVAFRGGPSTLRSAASTAVGGVTSLAPLCPGQLGPAGPAISGSGTIVALPGFARHLQANSPVRAGELLTFALEGQPGEVPLLLVSSTHEPIAMLNGSLLIGLPPTDAFVLPALPASGGASLGFPVPNVGAAVGSLHLYAQAVFLDPTPELWLGAGTTVVLLDASF